MPSRSITLLVRATGARSAARDLNLVSRAAANVGRTSRRANKEASALAGTMGALRSAGKAASLGAGLAGASILRSGLKFNAMMEQQKLAFTSFLGSAGAATSYLDRLYQLAAHTPFEFPDLVKGTRTMMAYGMASEDTYKTMKLLGDAIASAPTEDIANQIARTSRALGQIQAAGVLHAQDLNQLVDAGVTSVPKLAKEMGLSTKEFRKQMSLGAMDSDRFFKAQRLLWEKDPIYSGMAAKQSLTFYGQMATLHDLSIQTFGSMTEGIFQPLTEKFLPAMIDMTTKLNEVWRRKDITLEEKFGITRDTAKKVMEPLLKDFEGWWKRNDVTNRLTDAFLGAVWHGLGTTKKAGWEIAKSVFQGFKDATMAERGKKALSITAILLTFGFTRKMLLGAGKRIWGALGKGKGKGAGGLGTATGVMNVEAGVVNVFGPGSGGIPGEKPGKPGTRKPGKLGRLGRLGKRFGPLGASLLGPEGLAAAAVAAAGYEGGKYALHRARRVSHAHPGNHGDPMSTHNPNVNPMRRVIEPGAEPGGSTVGWRANGGLYTRPSPWKGAANVGSGYTAGSSTPAGPVVINVQVDGRTIASAVHREGVKAQSTR